MGNMQDNFNAEDRKEYAKELDKTTLWEELKITPEQYNKLIEEGKTYIEPYKEIMPPLNQPTQFRYEKEIGYKGYKDGKYVDGLTRKNGGLPPGTWKGRAEGNRDFMKKKESVLIPDERRRELYSNYDDLSKGKIGIPYTNGYLDLSKFAYFRADVRDAGQKRLSEYRYREKNPDRDRGMYEEFDQALDKRQGWESGTAKEFREGNDLTWHENPDLLTADLVPMDLHNNNDVLWHNGGHSIIKKIVGRGD
jgi:hypothetical protein